MEKSYQDSISKSNITIKADDDIITKILSFISSSQIIEKSGIYHNEKDFYSIPTIFNHLISEGIEISLSECAKILVGFSQNPIVGVQDDGRESGLWKSVIVKNYKLRSHHSNISNYFMFYKNDISRESALKFRDQYYVDSKRIKSVIKT